MRGEEREIGKRNEGEERKIGERNEGGEARNRREG